MTFVMQRAKMKQQTAAATGILMVLAAKRQTAAKTKAVPAAAKTAKPDEPTEQGAHDKQVLL